MAYDALVRDGKMALPGHGIQEVDARGLDVIPGVLDSHTHWGYRGDFAVQCALDSRAVAIGGVTTAPLLHRVRPAGSTRSGASARPTW